MYWWQEAMDKAFVNNFNDLIVITPCCNSVLSLNDLIYEWPAGFSSTSIEIKNAEKNLGPNEKKKLENILKVKVRIIWAHY